jgi:hypothetical protein
MRRRRDEMFNRDKPTELTHEVNEALTMMVRIANGETLKKVGVEMGFPTSKVDDNLSWFFVMLYHRLPCCSKEFNVMAQQDMTRKQIIKANSKAVLKYCELIRRECSEKTLLVWGSHFEQAGDHFINKSRNPCSESVDV